MLKTKRKNEIFAKTRGMLVKWKTSFTSADDYRGTGVVVGTRRAMRLSYLLGVVISEWTNKKDWLMSSIKREPLAVLEKDKNVSAHTNKKKNKTTRV